MMLIFKQTIPLNHPSRHKHKKAQICCVLHLSINLSMSFVSAVSEHAVSEGIDIQPFS